MQPKRQLPKPKNKLTYNEQRELETLPSKIEQLEHEIAALQSQISQDDFFDQSHAVTATVLQQLADKEAALDEIFRRWEQLDMLSNCVAITT